MVRKTKVVPGRPDAGVMVASAHEAHVAIRLLLGHPEP